MDPAVSLGTLPVTCRPSRRRAGFPGIRTAALLAALICAGLARAEDAPEAEAPEVEAPAEAPKVQPPVVEAPAAETPPAAAPATEPPATATSAPEPPAPKPIEPTAPPEAEAAEGPQGPDEITVEVDPGQSRNKDKSLPLAMLFSATLPGAGELYLNEKGSAKAFLLTEAGFWSSLYVAFIARESYLTSARNYASDFAGIDASHKNTAFLETMANYRSYQEKQHRQDSYELAQVLSGKREQDYDIRPSRENYWDFGSSVNPENTTHWRTFQSTLRYYRASKVAISFAVGALALNRLASLANTLRVYKRTSAKGLGLNLDITPELGPDYTATRLTLRF